MIRKDEKTAVIEANRTHETDTGSPEVQIAILSARISELTEHLKVHIHDNHSRPFDDKVNDHDEHLLPFDGTDDYEKMMRKLDEYNYTGSLMLEVNQSIADYKKMTHKEFLATCYERIQKISQM